MSRNTLKDLTVLFLILFIIAIFLDYSTQVSSVLTRTGGKAGAAGNELFASWERFYSNLLSAMSPRQASNKKTEQPADPSPAQGSLEWFVAMGQRYYAERNYRDAITYGETALQIMASRTAPSSKRAQVHELLASAYEAEKDYQAALLQYRYLTEIDDKNSSYIAHTEDIRKKIDGDYISEGHRHMSDARKSFDEHKYVQAFDFAQAAAELYEKAASAGAFTSAALALQSDCCRELKDYDSAICKMKEAISADDRDGSLAVRLKKIPVPPRRDAAVTSPSETEGEQIIRQALRGQSAEYRQFLLNYMKNPCTCPDCSNSFSGYSRGQTQHDSSASFKTFGGPGHSTGFATSQSYGNDSIIRQMEKERQQTQTGNEYLMQQMEQQRQATQARNENLIRSLSTPSQTVPQIQTFQFRQYSTPFQTMPQPQMQTFQVRQYSVPSQNIPQR
jgi:tetratricopeptide (TPR) repeat protein